MVWEKEKQNDDLAEDPPSEKPSCSRRGGEGALRVLWVIVEGCTELYDPTNSPDCWKQDPSTDDEEDDGDEEDLALTTAT